MIGFGLGLTVTEVGEEVPEHPLASITVTKSVLLEETVVVWLDSPFDQA
jgi:hypothetical protein